MTVAVLIPVLGRPDRVRPLLESLESEPRAMPVFIVSPADDDENAAIIRAQLWFPRPIDHITVEWPPGPGDYAMKINAGYARTADPWLLLGADDLRFHPGWLDAALVVAERTGCEVIATNDMGNQAVMRGTHATHPLVSRAYVEVYGASADGPGVVYHEGYDHQYCNPAEAPIWMADMSFRELGDVEVGDEVIGWERVPAGRFTLNKLQSSTVLGIKQRRAPVVRVSLESGRTLRCTADHNWLNAAWSPSSSHGRQWVTPEVGRLLSHVVDPMPDISSGLERPAAWLGGMYDGEGSRDSIGQSPSHNPLLYEQLCKTLELLGFTYTRSSDRIWVTGGRSQWVRFLNVTRPYRRESLTKKILSSRFGTRDRIVDVQPDGVDTVLSMTTETGNYVAWGYASKNCDTELSELARKRGVFCAAPASRVEHLHPFWGKGERDATYEKGLRAGAADRRLFNQRRRLWA